MPDELGRPIFTVFGAGNGGQAMAGYLALKGFQVRLYNRSEPRIQPIKLMGGIEIVGSEMHPDLRGFAKIPVVTTNAGEAMEGSDILLVVVPAFGHRFIAEQMAPHLKDGQIIVLNPGSTFGALEVYQILRSKGVKADVIVAEAQTFIFTSRNINPAQVRIYRIKNSIPIAAIPANRTNDVVKALRVALPQFIPAENVLVTSLNNIGTVFHPAITVLNASRIESTHGEFEFYIEGVTPAVASILERMDEERCKVMEALEIKPMTAREWLYVAYDATGTSLFEAIHNNRGYYGIKAPPTLEHLYITEDVPMSLVPIASLGNMLGIAVDAIETIIKLACLMLKRDFWEEGRTMERLGLAGRSVQEIRRLALEGKLD
jgi:opine dehydrogenase